MHSLKTKFFAVMILSVLPIFGVFASEQTPQLHNMLAEASEAFSTANKTEGEAAKELYLKAARLFRKTARQGSIDNAKLYYNTANSYLLAGDTGRAIYYYKKAEKLDPTDPLIRGNLAVARSKRLDKIEVEMEKKVLEKLFFWHYDFSLPVRFYVAVTILAVSLALCTVKIWLPAFAAFKPLICVLSILFIAFAGSVAVERIDEKTHTEGVIVASEAIARKGDSEKYEKAFEQPLHSGTEFELVEKRQGWIKVKLADGSKVWLPEKSAMLL